VGSLKDKKVVYRRLKCEKAMLNRGMTAAETARECQKRAIQLGYNCTFNDRSVAQYINCDSNFSRDRLYILADVLGVRDTKEIDEKFRAPEVRFIGLPWVGEFGNVAPDIKLE
jgi:hypothetical protein